MTDTGFRWHCDPSAPDYAQAWPALLADTDRILTRVARAGIRLAGPNGSGTPLVDAQIGIGFNGDAHAGEHGEAFRLRPPSPHTRAALRYCLTGDRPYSLAVGAVLLRGHTHLVTLFPIGSNATWAQWDEPRYGQRPDQVSIRGLVAELFGADTVPTTSPLGRTFSL